MFSDCVDCSDIQETDPLPLALYAREREPPIRWIDWLDETRCKPASRRCRPLSFAGRSLKGSAVTVGLCGDPRGVCASSTDSAETLDIVS